MKIQSIDTESIQGTYNNIKVDLDRYNFIVRSPLATKEYSITIDFINRIIEGDTIQYGGWYDLEFDEIEEFLPIIISEKKVVRDFNYIWKQQKLMELNQ